MFAAVNESPPLAVGLGDSFLNHLRAAFVCAADSGASRRHRVASTDDPAETATLRFSLTTK
jgi:hypothetical protein